MAAKKIAKRKKPKEVSAEKVGNPWAAHGFKGDATPFNGAAPPIHKHHNGRYLKKKKEKS